MRNSYKTFRSEENSTFIKMQRQELMLPCQYHQKI